MKLILTQAEHDALRDIRMYNKHVTLIGVLEKEFNIFIEIDDIKAALERAYVLDRPKKRRQYLPVTPLEYYNLQLIAGENPPAVLKHLLFYSFDECDNGFPLYITPQATIIETPNVFHDGCEYKLAFKNARPGKDVYVKVYKDDGCVIFSDCITPDETGSGTICFEAESCGDELSIRTKQVVHCTENGDVLHKVRVFARVC